MVHTMPTTLNRAIGRSGRRKRPRSRSAFTMHTVRRLIGLTMRQLALHMSTSKCTICRWESGAIVPPPAQRQLLALTLQCPALVEWDTRIIEHDPDEQARIERWAARTIPLGTDAKKRGAGA